MVAPLFQVREPPTVTLPEPVSVLLSVRSLRLEADSTLKVPLLMCSVPLTAVMLLTVELAAGTALVKLIVDAPNELGITTSLAAVGSTLPLQLLAWDQDVPSPAPVH